LHGLICNPIVNLVSESWSHNYLQKELLGVAVLVRMLLCFLLSLSWPSLFRNYCPLSNPNKSYIWFWHFLSFAVSRGFLPNSLQNRRKDIESNRALDLLLERRFKTSNFFLYTPPQTIIIMHVSNRHSWSS
jgi:hypothetical protein